MKDLLAKEIERISHKIWDDNIERHGRGAVWPGHEHLLTYFSEFGEFVIKQAAEECSLQKESALNMQEEITCDTLRAAILSLSER